MHFVHVVRNKAYIDIHNKLSCCRDSSRYDKISDTGMSANPNHNRNPFYYSRRATHDPHHTWHVIEELRAIFALLERFL